MTAATLSQAVLDEAIRRAVRLESGAATEQERAACAAWRMERPSHEQAWQQVQAIEREFRAIPSATGSLASSALQEAQRLQARGRRRRDAIKLLGWGAMGTALGAVALHWAPWQQRSTYATLVGERRRMVLADGTELQLNTGSDAEVVFSPLRRLVVLRRGEIFLNTGSDANAAVGRRSFWVETAEARLEALGTRFGVRQREGETRVHVTEGRVAVHVKTTAQFSVVQAGDAVIVRASEPAPVPTMDASFDRAAWADGVLVAKQMRLDAFVEELARYRPAPLHCDPAVSGLRVSGVFQLDGPDPVARALEALVRTLPIVLASGPKGEVTLKRA